MNKKIAALAISLMIGVTACTAEEPGEVVESPSSPKATVTAPPAPIPTQSEILPEPTEEPSVQDELAAFGEVYEYTDGISITVALAGETVAGEYAAGAEAGARIVLFDVTVTNGTPTIFDPSMVYSTVNYGTTTAERVFDEGLTSTFEGKVVPGGSITEQQGYAIPAETTDVLFSVAPDWDHEEVLFFGNIQAGA